MHVDLFLVTTSSYFVCCVFCLLRSAYTIKTITPVKYIENAALFLRRNAYLVFLLPTARFHREEAVNLYSPFDILFNAVCASFLVAMP